MECSIEEEVADDSMRQPHVVLLGAGASRAAFMHGDKTGKKLPLMADYSDIVGLTDVLAKWKIDPKRNFEDTFSELYESGNKEKVKTLERKTEEYFRYLELPDTPTIYDYLVLSLREKDLIATFNWDPLLVQAHQRSRKAGLALPKLAFLHGNISIGYCQKHRISGLNGRRCNECNETLTPTPLLYPIREKNYANDNYIASQWQMLKRGFKNAFMITIFGYSGPKTDQEAISLMKNAWGEVHDRNLEQTCFITIEDEEKISEHWSEFIHTHHYEVKDNFFDSWIAKHPRRTGEAYLNQYMKAKFIEDNPVPQNIGLHELREWYGQFIEAEQPDDE